MIQNTGFENSAIKQYLFSTPKKLFLFGEANLKLLHLCSKTHGSMANRAQRIGSEKKD